MIVTKRFILVALMLVIITPFLCGQGRRSIVPSSDEIRLVMNPLDEFSRAFGLHDERIEEAVRTSIRSMGFRTNVSSDLVMSVSVTPLPQQEEDLYLFRVEVHGATALEKAAGKAYASDIIGDIPAVRNISVPWGDEDEIIRTARQLARNVATELRKEIRRRYLKERE